MKKLQITVNGQKFDVEVEVIQDDDAQLTTPVYPVPSVFHHESNNVQNHYTNKTEDLFYKAHSNKKQGNSVNSGNNNSSAGSKTLVSPVNGTVLEVLVAPGMEIGEKEPAFAIEAMKMKTNIYSERAGKIKTVEVRVGDSVETGHLLLTYE